MNVRTGLSRRQRPLYSHSRTKGGVSKSNTTVNLPGIAPPSHHSTYLQTLGGLDEKVDYESKNSMYITREQSKLKGVLRRLNEDTLHLIDLIRPHKHNHSSPQQAKKVAEKHFENRRKIIEHLQHDMAGLEDQYHKLASQQSHSELTALKRKAKAEIQQTVSDNAQLKLQIQREGNHLTQGPNQSLAMIEVDLALAQQRLDRLRAEEEKVKREQQRLDKHIEQQQPKLQVCEIRSQALQGAVQQQKAERQREKNHAHKKIQVSSLRKKIDLIQSSSQYRYYKLLRELDAQNTLVSQIQGKTTAAQQHIVQSQRMLQLLQHQLAQVKQQQRRKNQIVMDFLERSRIHSQHSPPQSPLTRKRAAEQEKSEVKKEQSPKKEGQQALQEGQEDMQDSKPQETGITSKVEIHLQ